MKKLFDDFANVFAYKERSWLRSQKWFIFSSETEFSPAVEISFIILH